MAFAFERRSPSDELARWADTVWFARGRIAYGSEQIAPTGATLAVLNLGDPIVHATEGPSASQLRAAEGWLNGPHDRPSTNAPTGGTHCYGVVSTPVGCTPLFGLAAAALRGRVVPLERWKEGPALRAELRGLAPAQGLSLLLERLAGGLHPAPPRSDRVERAVAWLEEDPGLAVGEIARRLGLSHTHLDREFLRVVGLGPRRLAAILRVRRLLSQLDVFREIDWTAQAAAHGWYDQAHLIRDFRRYTGVSPTAYVAAQRRHFAPDEAADASGFVPRGREVESVQAPRSPSGEPVRRR